MSYAIGQIFTGTYDIEAAEWCNSRGDCYITEIDAAEDGSRQFQIVAVPEKTFDELQTAKLTALTNAFNERVAGSFTTSQGYVMQFDESDCNKMNGAITLYEASGAETGYLTQADDTTVYDIPVETMKAVLLEMLNAYAQCHARKQELRAAIMACTTSEELDAIEFTWPV